MAKSTNYQILVKGNLNKSTTTAQINKDLLAIQKSIKPISLKGVLDTSSVKSVKGVQAEIKRLEGLLASASISGGKLNNQMKQLRVNTANMTKGLDAVTKDINAIGDVDIAKTPLVSGMEVMGHSIKNTDGEFINFTQTLKDHNNHITTYQGKINKATNQMSLMGKSVKSATRDNANFIKQLVEGAKKFAIWTAVTVAYFQAIRAIKDGIIIVKDLDTALTELAKVASITKNELKGVTEQAFDLGETIGRTGQEVIEATADFARMGFTIKQSLDLAKDALILVNIGDGIEDVNRATETLIATLKGFNFEASESGRIVDVLNEVSNKYAVQTVDLAEGIKRVSAVMAQSNTSLEETVGLITAATEVIQDAEKASTGLRTISQRIRGVKEAMEEGESARGFTAKLGEDLKNIAKVDIMDTNNQLRSTYDILVDLSEVWDTLDSVERAYLGQKIAGIRQQNTFNAIMSNSETLINATTDAMNAQGSALIENEKYLESINGRLSVLNSTWQEFWGNTISGDTVKGVIDLATGLVNLVDKLGLLNLVLLTLSAVFGNKILPAIIQAGINFTTYAGAANIATVSVTALKVALSALAPVLLMGGLILTIKAIGNLTHSVQDSIDAVRELRSEYNQTSSELDDIADKYNYLASQEELNNDETIKLIEMQSELKAKYPEVASELDLVNGKLERNLELLQQIQDTEFEKYISDSRTRYQELRQEIKEFNLEFEKGVKPPYQAIISDIEEATSDMDTAGERIDYYESQIGLHGKAVDEILVHNISLLSDLKTEWLTLGGIVSSVNDEMSIQDEKRAMREKKETDDDEPYIPILGGTPKTLEDYFLQLQKIEEIQDAIATIQARRNLLDEDSLTYLEDLTALGEDEKARNEDLISSMQTLNNLRQDDLQNLIASGKKDVETTEHIYELKNDIRDTDNDILDLRKDQLDIDTEIADVIEKREKEAREAIKDALEEAKKSALEAIENQIKGVKSEIDALKKRNEEEERRNKLLEKQQELQEALLKLQNIKAEENVMIYMGEDEGWVWSADPQAVREQEKAISDIEGNLSDIKRENALADKISAKEDEIKRLEAKKTTVSDRYDARIEGADGVSSDRAATSVKTHVEGPPGEEVVYNKMSDGTILKDGRTVSSANLGYIPTQVGGTRGVSSTTNDSSRSIVVNVGTVETTDGEDFIKQLNDIVATT